MIEELVFKIIEEFEKQDTAVKKFKSKSNINCFTDCGACCKSPSIEATILEMLPLALEIVTSGTATDLLKKLDQKPFQCIMYESIDHDSNRGRCKSYENRPTICRLFGFTKRKDKDGNFEFSTCHLLKDQYLKTFTDSNIDLMKLLPNMEQYQKSIIELAPHWAINNPINISLKLAIEKILLLQSLEQKKGPF